jgi:transcriptional regulator with XRE-family HTH domain
MTSHPNRSKRDPSPARNPQPAEIREAAGLTQRETADKIYASQRAWEDYEQGRRRMHPAIWERFLLAIHGCPHCGKPISQLKGN